VHRGLLTVTLAGSSWRTKTSPDSSRRRVGAHIVVVIIIYIYGPYRRRHSRNGINGVKLLRGVGITYIYDERHTYGKQSSLYSLYHTLLLQRGDRGRERFFEGGGVSNGLFSHPYGGGGGVEEGKKKRHYYNISCSKGVDAVVVCMYIYIYIVISQRELATHTNTRGEEDI